MSKIQTYKHIQHGTFILCIHLWALSTAFEWAWHFLEFRSWFLLKLVWFSSSWEVVWSTQTLSFDFKVSLSNCIAKWWWDLKDCTHLKWNCGEDDGWNDVTRLQATHSHMHICMSCHALFFLHCFWDNMYNVRISKNFHETYDFVMLNNWLQFHIPATQQRLYSLDLPFREETCYRCCWISLSCEIRNFPVIVP